MKDIEKISIRFKYEEELKNNSWRTIYYKILILEQKVNNHVE